MKIDWEKVWKAYDKWWWKHCISHEQMRPKIQSLVESQLRKKVRRKK